MILPSGLTSMSGADENSPVIGSCVMAEAYALEVGSDAMRNDAVGRTVWRRAARARAAMADKL